MQTQASQALVHDPEPAAEPLGPDPEALAAAVDTHCHLFLMERDAGQVVADAAGAGVARLICVGIDPESSRRSVELAESFRGVFASAGVHPHTASSFDRMAGRGIEELLSDPLVVAVGETGLDYYRQLSLPEDQQRVFRTHIALSRETGKPLVVHVRDAWDDALAILAEERAERVVLHCFSGDVAIAAEAEARGYTVSFAANLTYPKSDEMRRAASALSAGSVVAETDSPFLAPQALRGSDNAPANLMEVLRLLADLRGVTLEEMVEATTRAAFEAFPLLR